MASLGLNELIMSSDCPAPCFIRISLGGVMSKKCYSNAENWLANNICCSGYSNFQSIYFFLILQLALSTILDILTPDDVRCLAETLDEDSRRGNMMRVFPSSYSHKYLRFFEQPRYQNILLDVWVQRYLRMEARGKEKNKNWQNVFFGYEKEKKKICKIFSVVMKRKKRKCAKYFLWLLKGKK